MHHEQYDEHVAAILGNPAAPRLAAQLQSALEDERRRREQFYRDVDDDMKAEFINGEVVVHSPVKKEHTDATGFLYKILDPFVRLSKLGWVGYEKVMSAFSRNDYEPDVVFFGVEKAEGLKKGQWKYPIPDLVVEVLSESTEKNDRGVKFRDFETHGISEYWIIDPDEETVEQYFLQNGKFKLHLKAGRGIIESRVVVGFSIDIRAVFDENVNLETLWKIMAHKFLPE
jgi:Uma2 family endonuclease